MSNKPIHSIKYGAIQLAVFERDSEKYGKSQSYALGKSYKDKDGKWQSTTVYLNNISDVVCAIRALEALLDYKYRKDEVNVDETP